MLLVVLSTVPFVLIELWFFYKASKGLAAKDHQKRSGAER